VKLSVMQYHRATVCLQRQKVSLWPVRWAVTRKSDHAWYTDPVGVTDSTGTWGLLSDYVTLRRLPSSVAWRRDASRKRAAAVCRTCDCRSKWRL